MALYKLKNPREGIIEASMWDAMDKVWIAVKHSSQAGSGTLDYGFSDWTAAKRYYTREYQSNKWGFEKPIWEEIKEPIENQS